MKCPFCGAPSDVMETRVSGARTRRTRKCFNAHKFPTYESLPSRAVLLARRNKQAAKRVLDGHTQTDVAKEFGMPRSELSRYLSEHHPGVDFRSHSQYIRHARRTTLKRNE